MKICPSAIRKATPLQDGLKSRPVLKLFHPEKRVLLVDDDPSIRESFADLLQAEGYAVGLAANAQRALERIQAEPVDIVLLDLNLPFQNGWDTFEGLTRSHPTVPVIIITGRANQVFTAVSAGAGALLEKPVDIPALLQTIERLLAETPEQHLARLAGKRAEFFYYPVAAAPASPSAAGGLRAIAHDNRTHATRPR